MKVQIYKIIKQTSGGLHSWVESNIGIIRKPNSSLNFIPVKPEKIEIEPVEKLVIVLSRSMWYNRLWNFVLRIFGKTKPPT